jgi:hypothetical protein
MKFYTSFAYGNLLVALIYILTQKQIYSRSIIEMTVKSEVLFTRVWRWA